MIWFLLLTYVVNAVVVSVFVTPWFQKMAREYASHPEMRSRMGAADVERVTAWGPHHHVIFGLCWPGLAIYYLLVAIRRLTGI